MPGDTPQSLLRTVPGIKVSRDSAISGYNTHVRLMPLSEKSRRDTYASSACVFRVCIRDAKEAFSVRPRFPETIGYMTLDVEDNEEQNLIRLFPQYVSLSPVVDPSANAD